MGPDRARFGVFETRIDNTSAVAWQLRHNSKKPIASALCRMQGDVVADAEINLVHSYIPGEVNIASDTASRSFVDNNHTTSHLVDYGGEAKLTADIAKSLNAKPEHLFWTSPSQDYMGKIWNIFRNEMEATESTIIEGVTKLQIGDDGFTISRN